MDPVIPMVQCNIVKTQVSPFCAGSVGDIIEIHLANTKTVVVI